MVLLAADAAGYSNLCQLTTLRHLGVLRPGQETFAEDVGRPVTVEELAAHNAGVIALWPAEAFLRIDMAESNGRSVVSGKHSENAQSPSGAKARYIRTLYAGAEAPAS